MARFLYGTQAAGKFQGDRAWANRAYPITDVRSGAFELFIVCDNKYWFNAWVPAVQEISIEDQVFCVKK